MYLRNFFGYCKLSNKKNVIIIAMLCIYLCTFYILNESKLNDEDKSKIPFHKYLVNSPNCRIPYVDPFNEDVSKYVSKVKYRSCSNLPLLTYINKSDGLVTLNINSTLLAKYSIFTIKCCYSKIYRYVTSDNKVSYSPCVEFKEKVTISHPFVKVECSNFLLNVYTNVHAVVIPTSNRTIPKSTKRHQYSVLMIGIDSMSHMNLRRTMPKTYRYLRYYFVSLNGYNKVGDNTFPNLMAALTGQEYRKLIKNCTGLVEYNRCPIIWDAFKKHGYVTGYAEDCSTIGSFNYLSVGFSYPPTDYYYRPYILAAEQIGIPGNSFCAGPEGAGERILNAAKDFSISFKDVPSFGFFWMNSFSHDDINLPSAMDEKLLDFLSDAAFKAATSDTIIIFFSDHGFRFGDIRFTHTGWLEERLPFLFFYIPKTFKKEFIREYDNLIMNGDGLSTPYDLYNTLQHVLELGNEDYKAVTSTGCPNCQSLFKIVPDNRGCKDAGIDQHWCTCTGHTHVNPNGILVKYVAKYIVGEINDIIKSYPDGRRHCCVYKLQKVITAGMSEPYLNDEGKVVKYFLLIIETDPMAIFEATVEEYLHLTHLHFKLLGDISRLNQYKQYSECVQTSTLKKYCFCASYPRTIKSKIYYFFRKIFQ